MRNKYSFSVVSIITLLLFFFAVFISSNFFMNLIPEPNPVGGAPPPTQSPKYAAEVHYKEAGFEPQIITLKYGETVLWINDSINEGMWVASDPHPTHDTYKGFDQLHGVGAGVEYTFTFTKTGIWSYHNNLSEDKKGKIIVL